MEAQLLPQSVDDGLNPPEALLDLIGNVEFVYGDYQVVDSHYRQSTTALHRTRIALGEPIQSRPSTEGSDSKASPSSTPLHQTQHRPEQEILTRDIATVYGGVSGGAIALTPSVLCTMEIASWTTRTNWYLF